MAVPLKLNNAQKDLLMNDPVHYNVSLRYISKEDYWECECDGATARKVKEIVDN